MAAYCLSAGTTTDGILETMWVKGAYAFIGNDGTRGAQNEIHF